MHGRLLVYVAAGPKSNSPLDLTSIGEVIMACRAKASTVVWRAASSITPYFPEGPRPPVMSRRSFRIRTAWASALSVHISRGLLTTVRERWPNLKMP
ncbi:hypothetical protein [Nonomuraea rubra]|uniref:hypothetical protein n=1 Tax=Nonomuraea rubra TaxID=46180 RepID=UPI0033C0F4CF